MVGDDGEITRFNWAGILVRITLYLRIIFTVAFINMRRLVISTSRSSSTTTKVPSFHKRQLPVTLTAMASPAGKQLFREALGEGGLESYFPLAEQFVTQSEPSFCSVSTLAMVLNALSFDPKKVWKGSWRWVSEETLQCESSHVCGHSMEKIKTDGLSFVQFESLARCHGVKITSHRVVAEPEEEEIEVEPQSEDPHVDEPCPESIETFRALVEKISQDDQAGTFMVVNYSRKVLNQTGDGHFSPIGGYHKEKDLVLIMDVARFKYPPYWVPLSQLWDAMAEPDKVSGEPRGYFVISGWNDKAAEAMEGLESVETVVQRQTVRSEEVYCTQTHTHTSACCTVHGHGPYCSHHSHSHSHSHSHAHTRHAHVHGPGCEHHHHDDQPAVPTSLPSITPGGYLSHSHRLRHSAISTATLARQNQVRVHEDASLNMKSPQLCPPMIRTWQDFKKYEPRGCCPKHRKQADRHATAEWFASMQ